MRFEVKLTPNSSKNSVDLVSDKKLLVKVTSPANENKANLKMIDLLSDHFNVSKSNIHIVKGLKSRIKLVEIGQS